MLPRGAAISDHDLAVACVKDRGANRFGKNRGIVETSANKFKHLKIHLKNKARELLVILSRRQAASRLAGLSPEIDVVAQTLIQVQDALRRIQFQAYGACIACGRQIEWHHLERTPWTPYCIEDQSKYGRIENSRRSAVSAGKTY